MDSALASRKSFFFFCNFFRLARPTKQHQLSWSQSAPALKTLVSLISKATRSLYESFIKVETLGFFYPGNTNPYGCNGGSIMEYLKKALKKWTFDTLILPLPIHESKKKKKTLGYLPAHSSLISFILILDFALQY